MKNKTYYENISEHNKENDGNNNDTRNEQRVQINPPRPPPKNVPPKRMEMEIGKYNEHTRKSTAS